MMNMKHLAIIFGAALLAASCTCTFNGNGFSLGDKIVRGNGVEAQKIIEVGDFNAVSLAGSLDVIFTQTEGESSVVLHSDENLLDYYRIELDRNTLVVSTKPYTSISPKAESYISVCAPSLEAASVMGSGDIVIDNDIQVDGPLSLSVAGSGDISADRIVCKEFEAKVAGSGDIDAGPVTAEDIKLSVAGSGDIDLELIDAGNVNAKIAGSGDITLLGNARSISSKVTGSGDVHTTGLKVQ